MRLVTAWDYLRPLHVYGVGVIGSIKPSEESFGFYRKTKNITRATRRDSPRL